VSFPLALAGALPALAAMWYVDRLDARRPEPRWSLRKLAIAGGISVVPAGIVELALQKGVHLAPVGQALFTAFVVAAGVEELFKVLCLRWFIWRKPELDERMDGIVYATRAGLGFALVENVLFLMGTQSHGEYLGMYIGRAILAVPGHAIYAGMMGYFAARKRFDGVGPGLLGGYLLAVLLHGTYDAALFVTPAVIAMTGQKVLAIPLLLVPVLVVLVGGILLKKMANRALALDHAAEQRAAEVAVVGVS
jgi:RsiW-degrading membrane proteinase PrsW (M82 family)